MTCTIETLNPRCRGCSMARVAKNEFGMAAKIPEDQQYWFCLADADCLDNEEEGMNLKEAGK